ncbi:MAG TPA: hypothetical protein VHT70_04350 [Candidatus Saccharimonadales bacterium]|jgi:hypothetical protein|nr:hypothetical protein [Candidatus Saccharimonadales bacterium]
MDPQKTPPASPEADDTNAGTEVPSTPESVTPPTPEPVDQPPAEEQAPLSDSEAPTANESEPAAEQPEPEEQPEQPWTSPVSEPPEGAETTPPTEEQAANLINDANQTPNEPGPASGSVFSPQLSFGGDSSKKPNSAAQPAKTPTPPVVPSTPSSEPLLPATTAGHRGKKWLKPLIIIAVIVVLLAAAVAYAAYYIPNRPAMIVARSLGNFVSGAQSTTAFSGGVASITQPANNASATFSGGINTASGAFTIQSDFAVQGTKGSIEVRNVDATHAYFKGTNLNVLGTALDEANKNGSTLGAQALKNASNNQWYSITQASLKTLVGSGAILVAPPHLSGSDYRKVEIAYLKHQFITVPKVYADETVTALPSHRYQVAIDKTKLHDFLTAIQGAHLASLPVTSDEIAQFDKVDFSHYTTQIWITKNTNYIDQISVTTPTRQAMAVVTGFGQPLTVSKPSGSIKTDTNLLSDFLNALSGNSGAL